MDSPDSILIGRIGQQHAGAYDIICAAAQFFDSAQDEDAAAFGLSGCIAGRGRAIVFHRTRSGHDYSIALPHRPSEAELRFVGRSGEGVSACHPQVISVIFISSS